MRRSEISAFSPYASIGVICDGFYIHGSYRALCEVLDKAGFNPDEDELYSVGDIADGYPDVYECLAFLRTLPSFHPVIGNHDAWLQNWLYEGTAPSIWVMQGGRRSIESFTKAKVSRKDRIEFAEWMSTWPYAILLPDAAIMHGGPGTDLTLDDIQKLSEEKRNLKEPASDGQYIPDRPADTLMWDRIYFRYAEYDETHGCRKDIGKWDESIRLFTGHTEYGNTVPFISHMHNFVNLDTMAGSFGCLTLMDMDTLEYWQSKKSKDLYGFCSIS